MNGKTYRDKYEESLWNTDPAQWQVKELQDIDKVIEAVKTIVDFGNVMGRKPEQVAEIINDTLETQHRTLQQAFISGMIQSLVYYADAKYDARNEYSVKTCSGIKAALEVSGKTYNFKYSAPSI